ncbi:MAG: purine-nucleoside phosphorylase, partial [Myxococcota bacterium]
LEPSVAVVLGSGLGAFAAEVSDAVRIPYGEIPNFPVSSVTGHAGELVLGELKGVPVAVMSGRLHFYEGHSLAAVTLPTRVLGGLGAKKLLVTNAAGGVNPNFPPGTLMVITDHINLTGNNPLMGPNDDRLGPRFPDMSEPYSREGQEALRAAAAAVGVTVTEGVYCGVLGPSYETPAEVRMLQRLGGDAVGMSTVPEVIVANHAGMNVAGLSLITNAAAGLTEEKLSHADVKEQAGQSRDELVSLLIEAVVRFAA